MDLSPKEYVHKDRNTISDSAKEKSWNKYSLQSKKKKKKKTPKRDDVCKFVFLHACLTPSSSPIPILHNDTLKASMKLYTHLI